MHFNNKIVIMKKEKLDTNIEEIRQKSKWLKLFENVPYNNSKVGQCFVMKVSHRKKNNE